MKRLATSWAMLLGLALLPARGAAQRPDAELGSRVGWIRTDLTVERECSGNVCMIGSVAAGARSAASGAFFAQTRVWRRLSVQAELQYAPKGYGRTQPTVHADYLEAPLLVRFDPVGHGSPVSPYLLAGVAPGVRVRCAVYAATGAGWRQDSCGGYFGTAYDPARLTVERVLGLGLRLGTAARALTADYRRGRSMQSVRLWNLRSPRFAVDQLSIGATLAIPTRQRD